MAQDTLLGFPAHTLPYRRGEFTTLSTVSLYRICAKKVRLPPDVIPFFCISERPIRPGQDGAFPAYLFLHEIEKPLALFSAATFTKDEMRAKKLLTFGFHLAMMQPTKRNDTE